MNAIGFCVSGEGLEGIKKMADDKETVYYCRMAKLVQYGCIVDVNETDLPKYANYLILLPSTIPSLFLRILQDQLRRSVGSFEDLMCILPIFKIYLLLTLPISFLLCPILSICPLAHTLSALPSLSNPNLQ